MKYLTRMYEHITKINCEKRKDFHLQTTHFSKIKSQLSNGENNVQLK